MTALTSLADRMRGGETLLTAWSGIPDAMTMEVLAGCSFDAVTLDMQHGGHDEGSVLRCIAPVLAAGKPAVVRIPVGRFDMASRALDFGADAVIAPMINKVADAKAFASAMKFPPVGGRSWGPTLAVARRKLAPGQAYLESANAQTLSFAMIETREAYALTEEILDVDGIDGVFVGPSDFSIAWTSGQSINPLREDMMPAIADIAAKAKAAGKLSAIYVMDPGLCGGFAQMGYQMMALANENAYLALGAKALTDKAHKAMGQG